MNNKNMGGKDADKNRSPNRQDEQQPQQARDREDKSGQQGALSGGQTKKPNQDQGGRH